MNISRDEWLKNIKEYTRIDTVLSGYHPQDVRIKINTSIINNKIKSDFVVTKNGKPIYFADDINGVYDFYIQQ